MAFTGLKIERHSVYREREICVWYIDGERAAVIYPHADKHLRVVHQPDVTCQVLERDGLASFIDVTGEAKRRGEDNS